MLSIQRGPHYNTPKDKLVIVAANYDTEKDVPGVDDNGSGVAAVLETARTLATFDKVYGRLNTIIYAFFDMKHQVRHHAFVEEVLLPYLAHTNTTVAGVLILDGLLHFDAFPTSQGVPKGFEEMFPTAARELHEHQHMGDYIQVTGRERKDDDALQIFFDAFYLSTAKLTQDWSFQPWLLLLRLPMHTLTSVDDYWFADSTWCLFLRAQGNLKMCCGTFLFAVKFRGVRQYCPYCDSLFMLTDPNMRFLTVIVEAVIRTVIFLSESEARTVVDDLLQFQRPNNFGLKSLDSHEGANLMRYP
ncbi:unnamed protein product [Haemonchus placei]|uniref:Peptidase M28 domain-containing protein n=1 Tax=Haemonchus placei TaxID=6290 RepID=A0A3P7UD81_HAEPC|nr:unnamed protein product [Haemonchus placei]